MPPIAAGSEALPQHGAIGRTGRGGKPCTGADVQLGDAGRGGSPRFVITNHRRRGQERGDLAIKHASAADGEEVAGVGLGASGGALPSTEEAQVRADRHRVAPLRQDDQV